MWHVRRFTSRTALLALLVLAALPATAAMANDDPDEKREGSRVSAKILGGQVDTRTDNRWVTALLTKGSGSRFQRQFCGGSLVARTYVLTAAHCVVDGDTGRIAPASALQALVGTKDLNRGGQILNVSRVIVYPRYRPSTSYGDRALLKLSRSANYAPASLVPVGTHYVGTMGYIAGWGNRAPIGSGVNNFPTKLYSANIPIVADPYCQRSGTAAEDPNYRGSIMSCAGYAKGSPDTCGGDSGGPLARKVGTRWRVVGVTSYGRPGCGSRNTYGVYAWVGSSILRGWLKTRLGF